jgi:4-amino-4-deoxy-L-arabinose transferase-like glycosyltransferase
MGYSPIKAGVAFLPFCVGIVVAAGLSSSLINRIDPRVIGGIGTLMASAGLFGFSRLPYDTTFPVESVSGSYVTDLLPFILLMSLGMGATFVPLTLTAVHHLRAEDSGIGSGVLNTMQQVGGALGLAILGSAATQIITDRSAELGAAAEAAGGSQAAPEQVAAMQEIIGQQIFTEGATNAFLVGSMMMLLASVVIWTLLNVKHQELATDGPEPAHVGV